MPPLPQIVLVLCGFAGIPDAADPFAVTARELADELGFALNLQHEPWILPGNSWKIFAAQNFNSYSNLGELSSITLKNGADAPLFLTEVNWAISDANDPSYYFSPSQKFHLMRGHTNLWGFIVLPPWLVALDNACLSNPACLYDAPAWCSNGGTQDCAIPGMYAPNANASLREHTLRRQVFRPIKEIRDNMGPQARVQIDVVNEMVLTVFPWQNFGVYTRLLGESDLDYWNRIASPDARVWSDIAPSDRLYFLELAFRVARAADPKARLFFNDYDLEIEGYGRKSQAVREVVRILRSRGAPVHGIGMQFHLKDLDPPPGYDHLGVWSPSHQPVVTSSMRDLKLIGVEASVTEFDLLVKGAVAEDPDVLRRHSRATRGILDACVDSENCHVFTGWGAIEDTVPPANATPFSRGLFRFDQSPLPAWWALTRGLARAVVPGSTVLEPEWFPITAGYSASGGQAWLEPTGDGYMFWGVGSLIAPVNIPVTGTYIYDVWATGHPAGGQNPIAELYLDSTSYGNISVGPGAQHYAPEWVLPAGNHTARLSFNNDYYAPPADRNLFVDAIAIRPKHRVGRSECHPIQVATMGVTEGLTLNDYGWGVIFTIGGYKEVLSVTKSGWYKLRLVGYGFGSPQQALLDVRVDGVTRRTLALAVSSWGSNGALYEVEVYLARGAHELGLIFTNDFTSGSEDLNVALGTIEVCPIYERNGLTSYNTFNTNYATQDTVDFPIFLEGGQTLIFGSCTAGASYQGDPLLRLVDHLGVERSVNDDTCGLGAELVYTAETSGTHVVRAGCWSSVACAGTLEWSIE